MLQNPDKVEMAGAVREEWKRHRGSRARELYGWLNGQAGPGGLEGQKDPLEKALAGLLTATISEQAIQASSSAKRHRNGCARLALSSHITIFICICILKTEGHQGSVKVVNMRSSFPPVAAMLAIAPACLRDSWAQLFHCSEGAHPLADLPTLSHVA
jgi:hypothetical protein